MPTQSETLFELDDEIQDVLSELGILTKLEEMDDFMNQNDLKVQITNENAVTTGLVTYTCTVKDKNNTALANKVVEWYKGTTLIGLDATDSNGVSSFSHRVTEADIYDVHAVVRGTHAGDDIRMFVKDKDNLCSYNVWSGSDYNNNISDLTLTTPAEVSHEHVSIGNNSIKVTFENDSFAYLNLHSTSLLAGEKYSASLKVYNNSGNSINLRLINISTSELKDTVVPSSDTIQEISNSNYEASNDGSFRVQINSTHAGVVYIDDIVLIKN